MNSTDPSVQSDTYKFLLKHRVAALATVDEGGMPHVVTIFYSIDPDLSFYFMTRIESIKFRNLSNKPHVSMVISDEKTMQTVQITGKAMRVENTVEEHAKLNKLWTSDFKNPNWPAPAVKLFESGHSVQLAVIKVVPQKMTYASFKKRTESSYESFFKTII